MPPALPTRLALSGRNPRRLPFERRLRLWLLALTLPTLALTTVLVYDHTHSRLLALLALVPLSLAALIAAAALFDQVMRPLQTLSNVVAALREDDFSFRARGARRGDSLGDLALEINTLAGTLQHQRSSALDALTLVERVLTSMPSPVLAFDPQSRLRLLNPAAAQAFGLSERQSLGHSAPELHLQSLLQLPDQGLYTPGPTPSDTPAMQQPHPSNLSGSPIAVAEPAAEPATAPAPLPDASPANSAVIEPHPNSTRWSVRRTTFRLHGVPHTLFVLADVSSALREEERLAWQRLIRVLGHEINNSLTPIKSIAGSLRTRLPTPTQAPVILSQAPKGSLSEAPKGSAVEGPAVAPITQAELDRGLAIIEDRADSLNRFLQAYQRLSRLPAPALRPTPLAPLAQRIASLETRLPIHILPSPDLTLLADPDQLQQLLINLLRNAVDAALTPPTPTPSSRPQRAVRSGETPVFAPAQPPTPTNTPQTPSSRPQAEGRSGETPVFAPAQPLSEPVHQPQVTLSWHATPTTAIIHVLDNGPGLTNPANLFVPFYTTKPGGSGIGLVLAQQIASAHHGTLTLSNRPHQAGCQAEIRLPLTT